MTLLSACVNVARLIPVRVPTVIVGSTDATASMLFAVATWAGRELWRRGNWTCLQTEATITTVASTPSYALATDFGRLTDGTAWDRTNYWDMRGPLSAQQWQAVKSSILASSIGIRRRYRIMAVAGVNKVRIDPTPSSADTLVYEYTSKNWCQSSGGTGQTAWAADTDVLAPDANDQFSQDLLELGMLWRFLYRMGMSYDEEKLEFEAALELALARDGGAPTIHLGGDWDRVKPLGVDNIQDGNFPSS